MLCRVTTSNREASHAVLLLIGAAKLFKAALLIGVGLGALRLLHADAADTVREWVRQIRIDPDNRLVHSALQRLHALTPDQLRNVSVGTFLYAALFIVEGMGLILLKRCAEYLTVVMTGAFLPLEIYEIVRSLTWVRMTVLAINVAILWYLIATLRRKHEVIVAR